MTLPQLRAKLTRRGVPDGVANAWREYPVGLRFGQSHEVDEGTTRDLPRTQRQMLVKADYDGARAGVRADSTLMAQLEASLALAQDTPGSA